VIAPRAIGLALLALTLAGCGAAPRHPAQGAAAPDGRRLYVDSGCGRCHALAAAGTSGGNGPDFDTSERLGLGQLRAALVEGRNGMPSYAGRLTPRQLDAVAAFVYRSTR
jgi:mono/diheme cytochrome c family protein